MSDLEKEDLKKIFDQHKKVELLQALQTIYDKISDKDVPIIQSMPYICSAIGTTDSRENNVLKMEECYKFTSYKEKILKLDRADKEEFAELSYIIYIHKTINTDKDVKYNSGDNITFNI